MKALVSCEPQVYWIFVTKKMGGVNFQFKAEVTMEIAVGELLAFSNIYYQCADFSKSSMMDQIIISSCLVSMVAEFTK